MQVHFWLRAGAFQQQFGSVLCSFLQSLLSDPIKSDPVCVCLSLQMEGVVSFGSLVKSEGYVSQFLNTLHN